MRILIIDNQFNQYNGLRICLEKPEKEDYEVYPRKGPDESDEPEKPFKQFVSFLSSVKAYIYKVKSPEDVSSVAGENDQEEAYRDRAWKDIMAMVKKSDLIIMDYRLGSPLTCMTGLEVATEIWKEVNLPILILSRDEQSREGIKLEWTDVWTKNYSRVSWEVKGYWGSQLLPEDFIVSIIIPAIKSLYAKWKAVDPVSHDKKKDLRLALSYILGTKIVLQDWAGYCEQLRTLMSDDYFCSQNTTFDSIYDYLVTRHIQELSDDIVKGIKKYVDDYFSKTSV